MKNRRTPGRLVAALRKIIGKSQTQFAAMIGVSKHAIISVENGRNSLSSSLAKRIQIATGTDLSSGEIQSPFSACRYTYADFLRWRQIYAQSTPGNARNHFERLSMWIRVVLLAAAKPGRAGNRDRLAALSLSFHEWLRDVRQQFKLKDEMEDIMEDETRHTQRVAYSISSLLSNEEAAIRDLAQHGIDYRFIKTRLEGSADGGVLIVQDEYRSVWTDSGEPYERPITDRRGRPLARCWVKKMPPLPPGLTPRDVIPASEKRFAQMTALTDEPESENLQTTKQPRSK